MAQINQKNILILFSATLLIVALYALTAKHAQAKYDRHDGSVYSCNTINSERAYALRHNRKAFAKLNAELKQYCGGY